MSISIFAERLSEQALLLNELLAELTTSVDGDEGQPQSNQGRTDQDLSMTVTVGGRHARVTYRQEGQDTGRPEVEVALLLGNQERPSIAWCRGLNGEACTTGVIGCYDPVLIACEGIEKRSLNCKLRSLLALMDKHKNTPVA